MLGDGQRRLGSDEVVAGVVAVSAHLTQDAGRAHAVKRAVQTSEARNTRTNQEQDSGSGSGRQPALVGAVRGEFVAAAAVGCVAEGSVGGGRTRLGAHNAAATSGAAGFWVPIRRFVSATLTGEVAAHPLHHLFHHLVFKLEKHVLDSKSRENNSALKSSTPPSPCRTGTTWEAARLRACCPWCP